MPVKDKPIEWNKYVQHLAEQQDISDFMEKLANMTGRELYKMKTLCLINKFLINRPVDYAFHRTQINYPVKPVDIMRDCMIDGTVVLKVSDGQHIAVEQYVSRTAWDNFTDELVLVETKYIFEQGGKDWYHIERFDKLPDGTAVWTIFKPTPIDTRPEDWKVEEIITLPLFPFVGIPWVFGESFLDPLKESIIRLEAAYRVIGVENTERMGLALYIEGVRNVDDIKTAPRKMGRRVHILPANSKFHSPSPDAPGMELMVIEIENLQAAIEKASGVVSTEKLASLSGISRQIAERPLIILADELRNRFTGGMVEVADLAAKMGKADKLKISYRPLKSVENTNEYLVILDRAVELNEEDPAFGITTEEYSRELRLLLDLSPDRVV